MSKRVTFASGDQGDSDSGSSIEEMVSTPSKYDYHEFSVPSQQTNMPAPFLSPGLSPIRSEYREDESDEDKFGREDVSSSESSRKASERKEAENNAKRDEIHDTERSNISLISMVEEVSASNRSLLREEEEDFSLNTISFLPEDDSTSFQLHHRESSKPADGSRQTVDEKKALQHEQSEHLKTSPSKGSRTPWSVGAASISSSSPYLKPGSLFTVVLDESGQPCLVPVIMQETNDTANSPHANIFRESVDLNRGKPAHMESPLRHHEVRENDTPFSPTGLFTDSSTSKRLDSKYFRDRLHRRSITSVLRSQTVGLI
jgi:hypothetical protein